MREPVGLFLRLLGLIQDHPGSLEARDLAVALGATEREAAVVDSLHAKAVYGLAARRFGLQKLPELRAVLVRRGRSAYVRTRP